MSSREVECDGVVRSPCHGIGTLAIHVGQEPEQWNSLAVVPPISLSTTFKNSSPRPGFPVYISV